MTRKKVLYLIYPTSYYNKFISNISYYIFKITYSI